MTTLGHFYFFYFYYIQSLNFSPLAHLVVMDMEHTMHEEYVYFCLCVCVCICICTCVYLPECYPGIRQIVMDAEHSMHAQWSLALLLQILI